VIISPLDSDRHARKVGSAELPKARAHPSSGFNKYYPPDYDGEKHKSLNAYRGCCSASCQVPLLTSSAGKHALGDRARKLDKGILITRFELPFNIWWYVSKPPFPLHPPYPSKWNMQQPHRDGRALQRREEESRVVLFHAHLFLSMQMPSV